MQGEGQSKRRPEAEGELVAVAVRCGEPVTRKTSQAEGAQQCGGCRMLGMTHEVTAPTGLPKVMESAVVQRERPKELDRSIHLWRL